MKYFSGSYHCLRRVWPQRFTSVVWRTSCRVPRRSHELSKVVPWYIMGLLTMLPDDTPRAKLTAVGQLTGLLTKNKRVAHGGRRAVQHRYGIQTSRIRPIAFDIVKDVGVSGLVQPCLPSHTLLWCAREDHGCDQLYQSRTLLPCPPRQIPGPHRYRTCPGPVRCRIAIP